MRSAGRARLVTMKPTRGQSSPGCHSTLATTRRGFFPSTLNMGLCRAPFAPGCRECLDAVRILLPPIREISAFLVLVMLNGRSLSVGHDPDLLHHAVILVFEDMAMEHELAHRGAREHHAQPDKPRGRWHIDPGLRRGSSDGVRHVNGVQEWRTTIDGVAPCHVAEINLVDVKGMDL